MKFKYSRPFSFKTALVLLGLPALIYLAVNVKQIPHADTVISGAGDLFSNGWNEFLAELDKEDTIIFSLSQQYDPFQRGRVVNFADTEKNYIALYRNKRLLKWIKGKKRKGSWELDKEEQTFTLTLEPSVGTLTNLGAEVITYHFKSYSGNRLVVSLPGRHGEVQYLFLQVDPDELKEKAQFSALVSLD